jgi:NitT/TauT family transport system ATP-binding protein
MIRAADPVDIGARSDSFASAAGTAAPLISIRGISKTFRPRRGGNDVAALRNIRLDIGENTFCTIVGPSGCGKTTLLRMINGLVLPDEGGDIRVNGEVPTPGPSTGFVFQSFRLLPWRTICGNIEFALEVTRMTKAERRERATAYLDLVGLAKFADAYPHELSGGMKQRVALARAMAVEPPLLLMDEPFASLDAQTREIMQIELLKLWERRKGVVVFVTHSVDEAILLSDQVVLMKARPGEIAEVLNVDLPRPRWSYDVRNRKEYIDLRAYLWGRLKDMVLSNAESEFFARSGGNAAVTPIRATR